MRREGGGLGWAGAGLGCVGPGWAGLGQAGLDCVGAPASGRHAWASQAPLGGRCATQLQPIHPALPARRHGSQAALPCACLSTSAGPARVYPTQLPLPERGVWHRRWQVSAAALIRLAGTFACNGVHSLPQHTPTVLPAWPACPVPALLKPPAPPAHPPPW